MKLPRWLTWINCLIGFGDEPGRVVRWTRAFFALGFAVATIVICVKLFNAWTMPILVDNQHYFYIAERAASGIPPHISNFDPKNHLSTLMTALAMVIGRWFGALDAYSARVLSLAVTAGTVALTWLVTRRLTRSMLAAHMAALTHMAFGEFLYHGSMGAQPKVFLAFFLLASILALTYRRPFLTGAFASMAFLCWQPALLFVAAAAPAVWLSGPRMVTFRDFFTPKRRASLLCFALGAVLPIAIYELYFVAYGALSEQLFQTYDFPAKYMADRAGGWRGFQESWDKLTDSWFRWFRFRVAGITYLSALGLSCLLAITWLISTPWTLIRRRSPDPAKTPRVRACRWPKWFRGGFGLFLRRNPAWIYIFLAAAGSSAFTFRNHQGGPDIFFVLPFVAIACGAGPVALARLLFPSYARVLALAGCIFLITRFVQVIPSRAEYYRETVIRNNMRFTLKDQYKLAQRLEPWFAEGRAVYLTGCTHLLAFIHKDNWVPYGLLFIKMEEYLTKHVQPFYLERDGKLPEMIFVDRDPFDEFQRFVVREYREVTARDFNFQRIKVFVRRDLDPPADLGKAKRRGGQRKEEKVEKEESVKPDDQFEEAPPEEPQ